MKTLTEYSRKILKLICDELEITEDDVISGKSTLATDARSIYIALLSDKLSVKEINLVTGISSQVVSKLKNEFVVRVQRWSVSVCYSNIKTQLR